MERINDWAISIFGMAGLLAELEPLVDAHSKEKFLSLDSYPFEQLGQKTLRVKSVFHSQYKTVVKFPPWKVCSCCFSGSNPCVVQIMLILSHWANKIVENFFLCVFGIQTMWL